MSEKLRYRCPNCGNVKRFTHKQVCVVNIDEFGNDDGVEFNVPQTLDEPEPVRCAVCGNPAVVYERYRCPEGHTSGFLRTVTSLSTQYLNVDGTNRGDPEDPEIVSEGTVCCAECGATAIVPWEQ